VETYNEEFKVQLNERHMKQLALFHYAWIGDYPDPYTFLQLIPDGFGPERRCYSNSRYDALLEQAGQEPDAARRCSCSRRPRQSSMRTSPVFHSTITRPGI